MPLRLATFNVENLMNRFDFSGLRNQINQDRALALYHVEDERQYQALESAREVALTDDARQLTALALAAAKADVACLQEIDNLEALKAFEYGYLHKMIGAGYRQKFVSSGNDSRGIDVAMMMRDQTRGGEPIEFLRSTSHARLTFGELGLLTPGLEALGVHPNERIFRRDCLEIDLAVGGRPLTLYLVHFKAMAGPRNGLSAREASMPIRIAEAHAVRRIIRERFGPDHARHNWAICGDLNDYRERIVIQGEDPPGCTFTPVIEPGSSIDALIGDGFAVNVLERLPPIERWTLYYTAGPAERHLCQLDYILLSPGLAAANPTATPTIIRNGQPWRTVFPPGQEVPRFPRIGWDRPKASDHCPVAITLDIP